MPDSDQKEKRLRNVNLWQLNLSSETNSETSETYSKTWERLTKEIVCLYCWKATLNLKRYFTLSCGRSLAKEIHFVFKAC